MGILLRPAVSITQTPNTAFQLLKSSAMSVAEVCECVCVAMLQYVRAICRQQSRATAHLLPHPGYTAAACGKSLAKTQLQLAPSR